MKKADNLLSAYFTYAENNKDFIEEFGLKEGYKVFSDGFNIVHKECKKIQYKHNRRNKPKVPVCYFYSITGYM